MAVLNAQGYLIADWIIQQPQALGYNVQRDRTNLANVEFAVAHHSVSGENPTIQQVNNWAISGANRVGYHFGINGRGECWQMIPLTAMSWGVANQNHRVINVCYFGTFTNGHMPTLAAQATGGRLFRVLIGLSQLSRLTDINRHVVGHNHFAATVCPGQPIAGIRQAALNFVNETGSTSNAGSGTVNNTANWTAGDLNAMVEVTSETLNVRSQRNATSSIVRTLRRGDRVRVRWILGINGANPIDTPWGSIEGGQQFINMNFVRPVNGNTNANRYFPRPPGNPSGLVAALNSINVDSSWDNRVRIANANGIRNYTGTAAQNNQLLNSLRQGLLIRP